MLRNLEELSPKKMALFFTGGVSMKNWAETGTLGRETAFYNELSRHLAKIYFLTYGKEDDQQYQKVLCKNIEIVPVLSSLGEKRHRKRLESVLEEVDFLKTHQVKGSDLALQLGKRKHRPVIIRSGYIWSLHHRLESRNPFSSWRVAVKEREIFKQCDAVLCTSQMGMAHARRLCGNSEKPIGWIPNYVDTSLFKPLAARKRKRSIIFVGRLVPQKNILSLLQALEGIDCSLTIIGDGPLREMILWEASRKKIKLVYHDRIINEKLPAVLNEHEVFILPSFYEGMPKALLEAMACGLAVIGSPIDGIKDLIEEGINGVLCFTDAESIRDALKRLFEAPELIPQYGKEAAKKVRERFDLHEVVRQEIDFYKDVLRQ